MILGHSPLGGVELGGVIAGGNVSATIACTQGGAAGAGSAALTNVPDLTLESQLPGGVPEYGRNVRPHRMLRPPIRADVALELGTAQMRAYASLTYRAKGQSESPVAGSRGHSDLNYDRLEEELIMRFISAQTYEPDHS